MAATRTSDAASLPLRRAAAPGVASVPERELRGTRPGFCLLVGPGSVAVAVVALVVAGTPVEGFFVVSAALVALWAVAGMALGIRRRQDRLGPIALAGAGLGALGLLAAAFDHRGGLGSSAQFAVDVAVRLVLGLLPAVAFHLLLALPDGRLAMPSRRNLVVAGYVVGLATGLALLADRDQVRTWPLVILWAIALVVGLGMANVRYRAAGAVDRRRLQWIGWALAVGTEAIVVVAALEVLAEWPSNPWLVALALTGLVPLALIAGTYGRLIGRIDRVLTYTVSLAGLTALIVAIYVVVVVGLSHRPQPGTERTLLLLSMVAAGIAALLYLPARRWLTERANRLVYGERVAPDQALRTFGQRLTRAIPMDELLLQLAESLRKSMALTSAEVWSGTDGRYELAAGVPHRDVDTFVVGPKERSVVARAGASGGTWIDIWLPGLAGRRPTAALRVAPIAHAGELLGLIIVARPADGEPFTEAEDAVLMELARQVGLALHNLQLDAALQASLEELQHTNTELLQSRARIVAAGDAERRKLERNLHDGAQQHLVALAVKIRLARDAVEDDPADAIALLDELKGDLQETIQEVRALAHGIYPPLLVSGGLGEALRAAATRAALATSVDVTTTNRYSQEIEAAVYFCCLEAMQNAAKHAGDGAHLEVRVDEHDGVLAFEVTDDGAGFDTAATGIEGHGFVNMADRLGAINGTLTIQSILGQGTTVAGHLPVPSN